jgi:hypothetical protein
VRAAARLVREKAETAAEQASRASTRRTAKRLKQVLEKPQSGKRHSVKAPIRARPIGGGEPQGAVAGAPALRSPRSCNITLSTRYQ